MKSHIGIAKQRAKVCIFEKGKLRKVKCDVSNSLHLCAFVDMQIYSIM